MIIAHRITAADEMQTAFAIRKEVFVEGQGVPHDLEHDAHDQHGAAHYLARAADGTACGTARWRPTDNGVKLERFAVLEAYRNQQVGAALLRAVLADVAAAYPNRQVYLNAQLPAMRFYQRHGFVTEGEKFVEADIEHYKMVWQLPLTRQQVGAADDI